MILLQFSALMLISAFQHSLLGWVALPYFLICALVSPWLHFSFSILLLHPLILLTPVTASSQPLPVFLLTVTICFLGLSMKPSACDVNVLLKLQKRKEGKGCDISKKKPQNPRNIAFPEAQKPKTFRVATFYAQKLSGRSAWNRFSWQA